ncbi:ABC transporter substrate-binding protein [Bradyrhizobium sp. LHD-71]|uniref:ABC transporter substrate-binding protein n=1 Tax=Bradyrhizobium sp. LHD-71 TaxID=3072141 RepID=UPI00280C4359|nr:ABC transporter substrate-binding protein [Bradyrhizobium sp. LHD-71]MDQ8731118.1 ABC transporter substrate-binding protein [Bradyrhizobium sp. LHD-71]
MKTIVLAAVLALSIVSSAAAQKSGGTLTFALNSDIRSLELGINRDANTDTVIQILFEGLVAHRADLSVGPALAQSWAVSDDGKTYTFKLRDGARFHNGAPVTSAEVKWTWDRLMSQTGWACKRNFDGGAGLKVLGVEAPDPATVVYTLEAPQAIFLKQLANVQCHVLVAHPSSAGPDGKWVSPVGSGPYKLKEWKRGELITLERHDGYKPSAEKRDGYAGGRMAYADLVVFRVIPDASAAEAALLTGAIDILPAVEPARVDDLKTRGMTVQSTPGLNWGPLLIQTQDPLMSNVKIRRAMAHAIDLDQIAAARTDGLATGNPSVVSESSIYFDKQFLAWPKFDPARAAALLKEAGYAGQVIKLQTNKRYTGMYERSVIAQAMLTAAGFKVELEMLDWATQLDNYIKGNFQVQSFGYSSRLDPALMYAAVIGDKSRLKSAQWDDPAAIEMLAESLRTGDEGKRKEIFLKLHKMMAEQVPIIGCYFDPNIDATRPNVHGYATWAADRPIPWGVWKE